MSYKSTEELSFITLTSYANFEERLTSGLKKDMRNLARALESVKIGTLILHQIGTFVQSRKGMTFKFTEELCVMIMKNNTKFEEELTFHFKTDMRNLPNFNSTTQKSKKISL